MKRHFSEPASLTRSASKRYSAYYGSNSFTAPPPRSGFNHLLTAISHTSGGRLLSGFRPVQMSLGRVLFDIGEYQQYVYFPVDCIVSLQQVLDDGSLTEIGVVGWEGMVGVSSFMNGENCCARALIQHAGSALRLDSNMLIEAFNQDPLIRKLLLHYTQILLNQAGQTAACNRYHRLDQQLCRWILLMLDRLPDNRLTFTQEIISNTLGVCREGITAAAAKMQAAGLISYSRGRITVLDRHGLEQRTCECYAKIKSETDRLLPREAANSRNVTLLHNL